MIEIMGEAYPRRYPLLDQESRKQLPTLYDSEDKGLDAEALVKFFSPDSNWTWYAAEFDGEDIFYGLVVGHEIELGYFSLAELEKAKGALGLGIERDQYFEPRTLRDLMELHKRERQGIHEALGPEEHRRQLINKLGLFGHKLAQWDKRIIEIVGIGKIAQGALAPEDVIQLVCMFSPEPINNSSGFFSIANLLVRNDLEAVSEGLGITHPIDLAFKIGGKICLPNGDFKDMPTEKIRVWPVYHDGQQPR